MNETNQMTADIIDPIEESLQLNQLTLEKWLKEMKMDLADLKMQWGYDDVSDLEREYGRQVDKDDFIDDETEELDEYAYEEALEQKFKEDVESNFDNWVHKYKKLKFPLTIYRGVGLSDIKHLDRKRLGPYWTDEIKSAGNYHGTDRTGSPSYKKALYTMVAKVKKNDIDWSFMVWNNLNPALGENEQEVNLLKGKKIFVDDVIGPKGAMGISFKGDV